VSNEAAGLGMRGAEAEDSGMWVPGFGLRVSGLELSVSGGGGKAWPQHLALDVDEAAVLDSGRACDRVSAR